MKRVVQVEGLGEMDVVVQIAGVDVPEFFMLTPGPGGTRILSTPGVRGPHLAEALRGIADRLDQKPYWSEPWTQ